MPGPAQGGLELAAEKIVHPGGLPEDLEGAVPVAERVAQQAEVQPGVRSIGPEFGGPLRRRQRAGPVAGLVPLPAAGHRGDREVDVQHPPEFLDRSRVVLDLEPGHHVVVDVPAHPLAHHQHRRRLAAAGVAAGRLPRDHRRLHLLRERAFGGLEGVPHRLHDLRPGEDVPLRRVVLTHPVPGPEGGRRPGVGGNPAVRVHHRELPSLEAGEGVLGEQPVLHLLGAQPLPEEVEPLQAVPRVHVGLRGDHPDPGLSPGHDMAHREVPGLDRDPHLPGIRVVGDDGEGRDRRMRGLGQRRRRTHREDEKGGDEDSSRAHRAIPPGTRRQPHSTPVAPGTALRRNGAARYLSFCCWLSSSNFSRAAAAPSSSPSRRRAKESW